jgi:hypothetical protein
MDSSVQEKCKIAAGRCKWNFKFTFNFSTSVAKLDNGARWCIEALMFHNTTLAMMDISYIYIEREIAVAFILPPDLIVV